MRERYCDDDTHTHTRTHTPRLHLIITPTKVPK